MVRCPAMTEFPSDPGRAVPGISPGPASRSVAVVPSTTTWDSPMAGMVSTAAGRPGAGTRLERISARVAEVNWFKSARWARCCSRALNQYT